MRVYLEGPPSICAPVAAHIEWLTGRPVFYSDAVAYENIEQDDPVLFYLGKDVWKGWRGPNPIAVPNETFYLPAA